MASALSDNTYLSGGFDSPVFQAQSVFKTVMDAMARPGTIADLDVSLFPPKPLSPVAGAVLCTLCDADTPIWLDSVLAAKPEIGKWISFQTDAPMTASQKQASFALLSAPSHLTSFEHFALGSQEYPETSTTLIINVEALTGGETLILAGPGIQSDMAFSPVGLPDHFAQIWADNRDIFPRGIDLIFCDGQSIACMPRSVRIIKQEA